MANMRRHQSGESRSLSGIGALSRRALLKGEKTWRSFDAGAENNSLILSLGRDVYQNRTAMASISRY